MLNFEGAFLPPGTTAELLTLEPELTGIFWGNMQQQVIGYNIVLSGASRDAGNSGFTTSLRPGMLLGRITASNKWKQWDASATDGSERVAGVLLHSQFVQRAGSNQDRFIGYVLLGGNVKSKGVLIAANAAPGIAGDALEFMVRNQMSRGFRFDDDPIGYSSVEPRIMVAKSASYVVTDADAGTHFTTAGAVGAVTFTLPTVAKRDLVFWFTNVVDQNMIVLAGTADTIITMNDVAADSVALQTASQKVGGTFKVVGDGAKWIVVPHVYSGQTVTVVT
jgi:hypothetical protein